MDKYELNIPDIGFTKNFTIIYKGKKQGGINEELVEIQTSKEELIRRFRYFNDRSTEIRHQTEIFIHDKYPVDIFTEFIMSLETKKIQIDSNNFSDLYDLSSKYEYKELQNEVEKFIKTRPDLQKIIESLLEKTHQKDDTKLKEEIIAQNLDKCLQNGQLNNLPISVLNRIFNSPKRVLNDHHLLFKFVIEKIENKKNDADLNELQILTCSLDFNEMSFEEIESLVNNENYSEIFRPKNSKKILKSFLAEREEIFNEFNKKISIIQEDLASFKNESSLNIEKYQNRIQKLEEITKNQEEIIQNQKNQIEKEKLERLNNDESLKQQILRLETSNRELKSMIENMKNENEKQMLEINNGNLKTIKLIKDDIEQEKSERIKLENQLETSNRELKSTIENIKNENEKQMLEINNGNLKTIKQIKDDIEQEKPKTIKLENQIKIQKKKSRFN